MSFSISSNTSLTGTEEKTFNMLFFYFQVACDCRMQNQLSVALTVNTGDTWNMIIIEGQSWGNWSHFLEELPQNIWSRMRGKDKWKIYVMESFTLQLSLTSAVLTCQWNVKVRRHTFSVCMLFPLKPSPTSSAGLEEEGGNDCYSISTDLCCMASLEGRWTLWGRSMKEICGYKVHNVLSL